jgi:hypothetical protein
MLTKVTTTKGSIGSRPTATEKRAKQKRFPLEGNFLGFSDLNILDPGFGYCR